MKQTRRGLLVLMVLLAVVVSLCVLPAHAANDTAKLILTPIEAMPNEQFKTTLCVAEGSEIVDFQIQLLYDTDVVQLVSAKASKDIDGDVVVNSGEQGVLKINYTLTSENTSEQMPIVDLVFATDEEIGVGGYEFLKENTAAAKSADRMVGTDLISVPLECDFSALNIYGSGDVDLNGNVEIRDVTRLRQYLAKLVTLTDYQLRMADAYYDEDVNVRDAVYIQQKLAEFNVQLGSRANVYFYDGDGNLFATKSVVIGSELAKVPAVPARAGYDAGDWSLTAGEMTEVDFSAVTKDMKVYAVYGGVSPTPTPDDTYSITYHLYDNDNYLQSVGVTNPNADYYSSSEGMTLKSAVVPGYSFLGWFDGQGANATQIKTIAKGTTGDLELFAHWKAIEYTINYEVGMGNIKSEGKFKVNENKTLTVPTTDLVPMMANYIFLGWTDESGKMVQTIPAGTVPDNGANSLTFKANWTSRRNMAHPLSKLGDPMIFEDTENGEILFTYELGTIENVPLYEIQTFDAVYGMREITTTTKTSQITKDQSQIISSKVSDMVTDSTEMTLSEGFTDQTSVYESSAIEHGKTREEANSQSKTDRNTITVNNTQGGSNSTTSSSGYSATLSGTQSHQDTSSRVREKSYEYGTASDYTANVKTHLDNTTSVTAGAEAGVSYGVGPAKASAKVYTEANNTTSAGISTDNTYNVKNYNNGSDYQKDTSSNANGWTTGSSITNSGSTTHSSMSTWNTSKGYENSHEVASTKETRQAVTELVSKQTGYGKDYIQNKSEENKQAFSETQSTENCNTSQITYGEKQIETLGKTYETSGTSVGRYRIWCAGTAHVFAVVGYDVADSTYYTYSMVIMDDETHDFMDYSFDGTFTDYDNGVLPFEVPYFVNEYVSNRMAKTDGLIVDTDTGIVTGFDPDKQATFVKIPAYVSVDNLDGTNRPVAITGISPTAFRGRTDLEAVVLNDFITEIPDGAFEGCTNLKKILMPGVTEIGDNAFKGCTSFVQFKAAEGVTAIGANAFEGVQNVIVKAANADVVNAVVSSGAQNITLNVSYTFEDQDHPENNISVPAQLADTTITVPATVNSFVLQGGGQTFKNLKLKSDAQSTAINQVSFSECRGIPLQISSSDVKLQGVSVDTTSYGMLLTADSTSISLYNNTYISSANGKAIVCRNLDVAKSPEAIQNGAASLLKVSGDILICGTHTGDSNVVFNSGKFVPIDEETFAKYAKGVFQVSFDANGGTVEETGKELICYDKVGEMPEPTRTGYAFLGWFTDPSEGTQITPEYVFDDVNDVTLYAHWQILSYTATWSAGTGYAISVNRTASPYGNAAVGAISSGATVYYGDTLNISYSAATGYTLGSTGVKTVTVTKDVTGSDIYASATANNYTYNIVCKSTTGAQLQTSTVTKAFGTTNTIAAPAIDGYATPASQSVTWDSTSAKTITFTYTPNNYTYNVVYKSSNGTNLGSTTVTKPFGTTNTITPPGKSGYNTPAAQSVKWDSTSAKTITFTYKPTEQPTPQKMTSGTWTSWTGSSGKTYGIDYTAWAEYRNRTANSVQIRVKWTNTITANSWYGYGQWFTAKINGTSAGEVQLATSGTWSGNSTSSRSVTGYSGWVTVSLGTGATNVSVSATFRDQNGISKSWSGKTIAIPAY